MFETVRVQGGRAKWREWHLVSIRESARALGLKVEEGDLCEIPEGDGIWRWFVTETGTRAWWSPGLDPVPSSFSLAMGKVGVWSDSWEARYKTLSYLSRIQARMEVGQKDSEVVMQNEKGVLASASMANLFWVRDGVIRTPSRTCGCRAGTVRRWVLEKSGTRVEEGSWGVEELDGAEEIFLTNARIGIVPVRSWQGKKLAPGGMSVALAKVYGAE